MLRYAHGMLSGVLVVFVLQHLSFGAEAKKKPVVITGDRMRMKLEGIVKGVKIYRTIITGNPIITTGSVSLRSDRIIVHGSKGERAECRGRVRLVDRKHRSVVRSRQAVFFRDENRVEFTGRPHLTMRRDDNSIVDLKATTIQYRIDDEIARASGNVVLVHKDMRVRSGSAIHSRKDATVTFLDNPVIVKGKDTFRAETIRYDVSGKIVYLEKNADIVTHSEEKDEKAGTRVVTAHTRGDFVEYHETDRRTIVRGNARVKREDSIFEGDELVIWGKRSEYARGTDVRIHYEKENLEARGKQFRYNKNRKRALLWGNPVIIVKNEEGAERARVYGNFMEFYQESDELFISGNVIVHRKEETLRGSLARFLRKENLMYIYGSPTVQREHSRLTADYILFDTKSHNARLMGNIRGSNIR